MFSHSKRIKALEDDISALKNLCAQLTANSVAMIKEYQVLSSLVEVLVARHLETERLHAKNNGEFVN